MIPLVMETIILYCNCQIYFYLHFITASCYIKVFTLHNDEVGHPSGRNIDLKTEKNPKQRIIAGAIIRSQIWDLFPNRTKFPKWSQKSPDFASKFQILYYSLCNWRILAKRIGTVSNLR